MLALHRYVSTPYSIRLAPLLPSFAPRHHDVSTSYHYVGSPYINYYVDTIPLVPLLSPQGYSGHLTSALSGNLIEWPTLVFGPLRPFPSRRERQTAFRRPRPLDAGRPAAARRQVRWSLAGLGRSAVRFGPPPPPPPALPPRFAVPATHAFSRRTLVVAWACCVSFLRVSVLVRREHSELRFSRSCKRRYRSVCSVIISPSALWIAKYRSRPKLPQVSVFLVN